jgi:hypothetical protein
LYFSSAEPHHPALKVVDLADGYIDQTLLSVFIWWMRPPGRPFFYAYYYAFPCRWCFYCVFKRRYSQPDTLKVADLADGYIYQTLLGVFI